MDFQTIQTTVLAYARRPSAEYLDDVKREINSAVRWANNSHDFRVLEKVTAGAFTANQLTTAWTALFSGASIKSILSVQLIAETTDLVGEPLKFVEYGQLQKWRQRLLTLDAQKELNFLDASAIAFELEEALGLFPTPTGAQKVLIHYNSKLPALSANGDTNFLLSRFSDFIIARVMYRLNYMLKIDDRGPFTFEYMKAEWEAILAWDKSLRSGTGEIL